MGLVFYPDDYEGAVLSGTVESLPEGVVFLPAAGFRFSSDVRDVGEYGFYWSSSVYEYGPGEAYLVFFDDNTITTELYNLRTDGHSVRLVTDVN